MKPSIVFGGAAGIIAGRALLMPGNLSRRTSLQRVLPSIWRIMAGTAITLAGFGANRGPAVQYFVVGNSTAAVWTPVASGGNYFGYQYDPNAPNTGDIAKRWGTNLTSNFPGNGPTTVETTSGLSTTVLGA